jgi:hypothetical protein
LTSTYARASSRLAHGIANATRKYRPMPRRFRRFTCDRDGVSNSLIFGSRRLCARSPVAESQITVNRVICRFIGFYSVSRRLRNC